MMTLTFRPTKQQQEVTSFFQEALSAKRHTSIFLNAVAGSGKTSTIMLQAEALMEMEKQLVRPVQACSVSFNTNIRDASQTKLTAMGSTVQAKTTNQLGRAILVSAAKDGLCQMPGKLENSKYRQIVETRLEPYMNDKRYFPKFKEFNKAITAIVKLVDAVRSTQVEPTEENILDIISHYKLHDDIDVTANSWELIWRSVKPVIQQGIRDYNKTGIHDFNDQICLPLSLDVAAPIWDAIFIDEAQDLNRARLEMLTRSIKPNGVLFFVGDPFQAIQGFTFADTDSVNTIKRVTNAVEFPLSVCWRCDENIIRLAQVLVPHIQARPNAPKGTIDTIDQNRLMTFLETGYKRGSEEKDPDLVLCRVKAPLVQMCLEAIRNGKSAIVRGRDIGKGIISLLEDILPAPMSELAEAINTFTDKKIDKLFGKKDAETKIAELQDRSDTLMALLDGYLDTLKGIEYADIEEFKKFINSKFADDETAEEAQKDRVKPIVFSTIHKAKGLEYDRVFILEPRLLPHPAAKADWQQEQERNIIYVAITRAKHALYFVGGVPACLVNEYNAINGIDELSDDDIPALIEVAEEIINQPIVIDSTLSDAPISLSDGQETVLEEKPVQLEVQEEKPSKRPYGGRKALDASDKKVKVEAMLDPSIRKALKAYASQFSKDSEAEVLQELIRTHPAFASFFAGTQDEAEYEERQARYEQNRQAYKGKKSKKVEPENPDPDDDPNGGGIPTASNPVAVEEVQIHDYPDNWSESAYTHEGIEKFVEDRIDQNIATSLFPAAIPTSGKVKRVAYTCLRPSCRKSWLTDYYDVNGFLWRVEDGKTIAAIEDFPVCPHCRNKRQYIKVSYPKMRHSGTRKCDSRCWNARPGSDCRCACHGLHHATGSNHTSNLIGQPLLQLIEKKEEE